MVGLSSVSDSSITITQYPAFQSDSKALIPLNKNDVSSNTPGKAGAAALTREPETTYPSDIREGAKVTSDSTDTHQKTISLGHLQSLEAVEYLHSHVDREQGLSLAGSILHDSEFLGELHLHIPPQLPFLDLSSVKLHTKEHIKALCCTLLAAQPSIVNVEIDNLDDEVLQRLTDGLQEINRLLGRLNKVKLDSSFHSFSDDARRVLQQRLRTSFGSYQASNMNTLGGIYPHLPGDTEGHRQLNGSMSSIFDSGGTLQISFGQLKGESSQQHFFNCLMSDISAREPEGLIVRGDLNPQQLEALVMVIPKEIRCLDLSHVPNMHTNEMTDALLTRLDKVNHNLSLTLPIREYCAGGADIRNGMRNYPLLLKIADGLASNNDGSETKVSLNFSASNLSRQVRETVMGIISDAENRLALRKLHANSTGSPLDDSLYRLSAKINNASCLNNINEN